MYFMNKISWKEINTGLKESQIKSKNDQKYKNYSRKYATLEFYVEKRYCQKLNMLVLKEYREDI